MTGNGSQRKWVRTEKTWLADYTWGDSYTRPSCTMCRFTECIQQCLPQNIVFQSGQSRSYIPYCIMPIVFSNNNPPDQETILISETSGLFSADRVAEDIVCGIENGEWIQCICDFVRVWFDCSEKKPCWSSRKTCKWNIEFYQMNVRVRSSPWLKK